MQIVRDEPKRQRSRARYGLDFADLPMAFFDRSDRDREGRPVPGDWGVGRHDDRRGRVQSAGSGSAVRYLDATGEPDRKETGVTTNKWPSFITRDLSPDDDAEMTRRWEAYDREMKALTATGGFHQDEDGWWVETATGDLVGPDPAIERPLSDAELARMKLLADLLPELAESLKRSRGRPAKEHPKTAVTLRIDPRIVERYQAGGSDWRTRMAEALERTAS